MTKLRMFVPKIFKISRRESSGCPQYDAELLLAPQRDRDDIPRKAEQDAVSGSRRARQLLLGQSCHTSLDRSRVDGLQAALDFGFVGIVEPAKQEERFRLTPDMYAVFFPEDIHRPGLRSEDGETGSPIRKAVFKIRTTLFEEA
ncbi:YhcH/YjgK/YiaL family protein [Paenibacillus chitinolyticus]